MPTVHVLADVLARANQVGDDTVIDFGAGDTLTLKFVSKANLTAGNFLLSNAAPVITSNGGGAAAAVSMAENTTPVTTVTASDSDLPTTLIYSITGGADAARFKIGAATGALAFIAAPDFEAPGDSDANNSYVVRVTVTDGDLKDTQTITVNVTDVNDQSNPNPSPNPNPVNLGDPNRRRHPLFDTPFYLSHNPTWARQASMRSSIQQFGFHEGRDPNAFFDTSCYLAVNQDVRGGRRQSARPISISRLEAKGAIRGRTSIRRSTCCAIRMWRRPASIRSSIFLQFGLFEGRQAYQAIGQTSSNGFDAAVLSAAQSGRGGGRRRSVGALQQFGRHEGRNPNALFDTAGYLSHYADVAAAGDQSAAALRAVRLERGP